MGGAYSGTAVVDGTVASGYESVAELFRQNFIRGKEREAQLCVYVGEELVVDLWGSAEGDTRYNGDSLQCVFSTSKAVTAIAIASIAQRGLLDYSQRVAHYWPEFGQNQKEKIRIEDLLRHEAGIPHLHTSVDPKDLLPENLSNGVVSGLIAGDYTVFPSNTIREYHNITAGWAMNEVVRRITPGNVTIGTWLREHVTKPLSADCYLGLSQEELPRVRDLKALYTNQAIMQSLIPNAFGSQVEQNILVFTKILKNFQARFMDTASRGFAPSFSGQEAGSDPGDMVTFLNSREWRAGESPHGNVHASARGLARLAAAMVNGGQLGGVRVLTANGVDLLHHNGIVREDASMRGCRTEFTQGGVNNYNDYPDDIMGERVLKSGRDGFVGWMGLGGSVMQWHPKLKIGLAYTCTLITWWDLANTKARRLQKEVVLCTCAIQQQQQQQQQQQEQQQQQQQQQEQEVAAAAAV